jgi:hypothetical protein
MSMKNFNDTIGNRSRDLPVCRAVPQPLRHRVSQTYGSKYDVLYEESEASSENNSEDDFSGSDDDFLDKLYYGR